MFGAILTTFPPPVLAADEAELWKKQEKRLNREAKALFKFILEDLDRDRKQCELPDSWRSESVPYAIAKQYLHHTIRADLRALEVEATTAEILDPAGKYPQSFCSEEQFFKEQKVRDDERKSAEIGAGVKDPDRYEMYRLDYTFPIFDRTYRTAIVMVDSSHHDWYKAKDGKVYQRFGGQGGAQVYRKKNGHWRLLKYIPFYSTHGAYKPPSIASLPRPTVERKPAKLEPIVLRSRFHTSPLSRSSPMAATVAESLIRPSDIMPITSGTGKARLIMPSSSGSRSVSPAVRPWAR